MFDSKIYTYIRLIHAFYEQYNKKIFFENTIYQSKALELRYTYKSI